MFVVPSRDLRDGIRAIQSFRLKAEWRLLKPEHLFSEALAPRRSGHSFKQDAAAELLHLAEGGLQLAPLRDGGAQPRILLTGECDADGLAFDLARPLEAGAARTGPAILHIASDILIPWNQPEPAIS